ncbi:hypothetical protein [Luteimonas terrae]|uniref:Uncharacterized protein n=1 Tax=Luteimonas terrae TaxID=1530191 RepID=A0A4R5UES1_9GAMM|nr:hypothetical protein [Luteimonas terrae]TDK33640.1 hypothetical protein E2F49_06475 [Luteimonas terrae]
MAVEQPMSEQSEFGLRAAPGEARREPPRLYRGGSRPAKGPFGFFWVPPKETRTIACESSALDWLPLFASLEVRKQPDQDQTQSFHALRARLPFVLSKGSKTAFAGRDPMRYSRIGPLRFSANGARSPNSLRSDMGCSSAPPSCDARLALRLADQGQRLKAEAQANININVKNQNG